MTQEQQELRRINWTETFAFTHIFKSFKMAIYPHQLALATAAIVLVFCVGWAMDCVWSMAGQYVAPTEITSYFVNPLQFKETRQSWQNERLGKAAALVSEKEVEKLSLGGYARSLPAGALRDAFDTALSEANKDFKAAARSDSDIRKGKDYSDLLEEADEFFEDQLERIEKLLKKAEDAAEKSMANLGDDQRDEAEAQLEIDAAIARQKITELKVVFARRVLDIRGETIFASLADHEQNCLGQALMAVRYGNFFGGMAEYHAMAAAGAIPPQAVDGGQGRLPAPVPAGERPGLLYWTLMAAQGVCWLLAQHWLYAVIFLILVMGIVALFGGACHRIAALHFAREEKISAVQALKFSAGKFLSFYTAPLIPLAVLLAMGVLFLTVGGLVASIPYAGEILMGLLFFLAIIVGLVIAFLLIGLVAGLPLMYPAIAVEGSDSFDAISRSISYVFSRPWRSALYGGIALIYGTVTYLFVRLFAFVALKAAHTFVGWGVIGGGDSLHPAADKLDVMWNAPTYDNLFGPVNWPAMSSTMTLGAFMVNMWVFLVAVAVAAYLVSYAASATTTIYYLLRRKVDATDMDEVYAEEATEFEEPEQASQGQSEGPTPPPAVSETETQQP